MIERNNRGWNLKVSGEERDAAWDAFLHSQPHGLHQQSSSWASFKKPQGWRPVRIQALSGPTIVGGVQLLIREFPMGGRIAYASRGPVVSTQDPKLEQALIDHVLAVADQEGIHYVTLQPPSNSESFCLPLLAAGFQPVRYQLAPTATVLVDITQDAEQVLARMRSGTRRAIRKAIKGPLTVRQATEQDTPAVSKLLAATALRQGFKPPSAEVLQGLWNSFRDDRPLLVLIAERVGVPVACEVNIPFGDVLVSKRCGWSGECAKDHPTELLVWSGMQWAREHGLRFYELEGVEPRIADAICRHQALPPGSEKSSHWFKLGFGGTIVTTPQNHARFNLPGLEQVHRFASEILAWSGNHRLSGGSMTGSLREYLSEQKTA